MDRKMIYRLADQWNLHREDLDPEKFYLFNTEDGRIIRLNEVSFKILEQFDGTNTLHDIYMQILHEFAVDENVLWNDIVALTTECLGKNVITEH